MGKFRKLSVVLLLAFVLLCCCAVNAYAEPYTVTVQFQDYYEQPHQYEGSDYQMFVYLEIKDKPAEGVDLDDLPRKGWTVSDGFNPSSASDGKFTFTFENFGSIDQNGNTPETPDNTITFDHNQYVVSRIRLYTGHVKPTYHNVREEINSWDPRPNDVIQNYKIDPQIGPTSGVINLQHWGESFLDISITLDPEVTTQISESDGYWIRVKLEHKTGPNTYYVTRLNTDSTNSGANPLNIRVAGEVWRTENGQTTNEKFTANEPYVTVQITKAPAEASEEDVVKQTNGVIVLGKGSIVKDYQVNYPTGYPDGRMEINNTNTGDDLNNFTTTCSYEMSLTKNDMVEESSLTPEDVLGDAANFGIVAERYDQFGHSETNFAVKYFFNNANIDVDGSGDTPVPFYVAEITDTAREGTINNADQIFILSEKTTVPADIYATLEDTTPINHHDGISDYGKIQIKNPKPTNVYPTAKNEIENYVDSLINYGKGKSAELASKVHIAPVYDGTQYIVDTTGYPDGTTIYINADGILKSIGQGGWRINKNPNQTIVFNITKETNGYTVQDHKDNQVKNALKIGEFYVDPNDGGAEVQSTTAAMNGDPVKNQRVDDVILSHIFFNVTNAEYVDLQNASGLFLLPNATQVTQENGAGWILAEGTVDSHAEWHFYRHTRNYVAKGGLKLETKKTIVNGSGDELTNFTFEMYASNENGDFTPLLDHNGDMVSPKNLIETEQADNTGLIDFYSFSYNDENVTADGRPKYFYYKIVEVIPDDAENAQGTSYANANDEAKAAGGFKKDNIIYDSEPILVRVKATNTPPSGTETEGEITLALEVKNGENWSQVNPTSSAKPPVFNLENTKVFTNTKTDSKTGSLALEGTKTVTNSVGRTEQTERHYTFSLCYAGSSGETCIEEPVSIDGIDVKDGETADFNFTGPMLEYDLTKLEELVTSEPAKATVDDSGKTWTIRYLLSEDAFTNNSTNQKWIKIDTNKILITVTVTDDDSGTLKCSADKDINAIIFVNTVRENKSVTLDAAKELTGRDLDENDKWTFKVEPFGVNASDAPLPDSCEVVTDNGTRYCTKQNAGEEIKFGKFTFTPEHLGDVSTNNGEKVYSYHVQEVSADTPSTQSSYVITDNEQKNFYVKVSLNGDALQAAVYSDEACTESMDIDGDDTDIIFTNQYHDNGSAILSVTKSMDYWPSGTTSYTFKLKAADSDTVSDDKLKDMSGYNSEDHSVTISVNAPSSGSITGSFPAITFSEADFVTATEPHHWNEFNYTITEVSPENRKGVTYSTDSYNVRITLADTGHDGKIVPTVQVKKNNEGDWTTLNSADDQNFTVLIGNGPTFTNSYDASGSLQFSGKKTLENWDQERTFQFYLTYYDSAKTPVTSNPFQTVTVSKDEGSSAANQETAFNFPPIEFSNFQALDNLVARFANSEGIKPVRQTNPDPKTWQIEYLLTEDDVTDNVIKQDKTEFLITATIEDNGDGTLNCSYKTNQTGDTANPKISFTNHVIQDIDIPISAKKVLNNGTLTNQKWNFTLTGDGPMPANCSSPCVKTNNGAEIDFGKIKFTANDLDNTDTNNKQKEKTYTYTITEEKITSGTDASPANVNIDPQITKTFTVTVSLNEQTKDMNAVVKVGNDIVGKNTSGKYEVSTFTNTLVNDNQIHFTITKKLIDNKNQEVTVWPSNAEFTLTLEGGDGENGNGTKKLQELIGLTQTVNSSNHTVSDFPAISFTNADVDKDFVFRVTEINAGTTSGGIEYSDNYPTITIRPVLDDNKIKLQQKTGEDQYTDIEDNTLAFGDYVNRYNASGSVTLAVTKSMKYDYWPKSASFSFSITDAASPAGLENVPKKTEGFADATATETDRVTDFGQIKFDQQDIGKTFYFTISENTSLLDPDVFNYPSTSYTVSVTVGTNNNGSLSFTIKDDDGNPIDLDSSSNSFIAGDFENEYKARGSIKLNAGKLIWDASGDLSDNDTSKTHKFHFILKHKVGTNEVDTILDKPIIGSVEISEYSIDGNLRINNFEMSEITYNLKLLNDLTTYNPALAKRVPNTEKPTWLIEYIIEEDTEANKTESNADIDLDHLHRPVTVQVVDNGDGTLTCTQVTCTADGVCTEAAVENYPLFENHEIHEGSVIIQATKILNGRDLTSNDQWNFILTPDENNPTDLMPLGCQNPCITQNNKDAIKFDPIHFTPDLLWNEDLQQYEDKIYKYSLSESRISGKTYPGITDDAGDPRTITITASYDHDNEKIIVTADPDVVNYADKVKFTNTYVGSGKVQLKVTKAMSNNSIWPKGGSFTFTIKEEDTSSIYTGAGSISVDDPQNPWALFSDINFDQRHLGTDKEYIFTIKETADTITCAGPDACVNYDPSVYTVKLAPQPSGEHIRPTVSIIKNNDSSTAKTFTPDENDEGVYVIPVSVDASGVTFTNDYRPEGSASLSITKNIQGADWPEENGEQKVLKFTLVPQNGAPIPEDHITEKELRAPGTVPFGEIKFPYTTDTVFGSTAYQYEILESTNFGEGWTAAPSSITATVTIMEDKGDGTLETKVNYSPENKTFTNSYETKGSLVLSATKAFNRWDIVDSFTFKLETNNQDLVDQQTVSESSPTAVFKQIDFSKFDDGKERTFTISEVIPNPPIVGVTYADPIVISITPVDNGDGTMKLYKSGTTEELPIENGVCKLNAGTLTNTYRSAGTGVIQVAKVLEGRGWNNDDTYTFTLEAVNGAPMPGNDSVTITKDTAGRTAAFDEIPFSEPGTYEYTVKETKGSVKGIIYDETVKTVTFTVERNEKGEIVAAPDSDLVQDVSFTNTYNAEGKLNLKSSKRIINNDDTREKHQLPFVLYHKYGNKNDYPDGEPVIERIVEVEDGILIDFDYPIYYSVDEVPESEQPADGRREVLNRLVRAGYARVISAPADTNTEWEVGYFLTELPAIDHQLKPPDQSFDILVTISDTGTGELKIEKVMVQALDQKGNIVEPFKEVSDDKGFAIGPFQNTERKDTFIELLTGTKILEGRDLTAADNGKWKVTISSDDENAPLPQEKTVPIMIKEENGTLRGSFAFGAITFKPEHLGVCIPHDEKGYICGSKDYHYTLTESGTAEGIINGPALNFIIRVSEADDGHVQADFVDEAGNVLTPEQALAELIFTNRTVEQEKTPEGPTFYRIRTMPETGFSALKPTVLDEQPKDLSYRPLAWTLEIPSLALMTDIVEVPSTDGTYPVTWLGSSAGLLEGFGLPGSGHSVLTGHNHLNTMEAGPFALLQEMGIGDRIFVLDPQNEMQIFTVYANEKITETDIRGLQRIAERFDDSLTLITCEDERVEGGYANRRIIAAKPIDR